MVLPSQHLISVIYLSVNVTCHAILLETFLPCLYVCLMLSTMIWNDIAWTGSSIMSLSVSFTKWMATIQIYTPMPLLRDHTWTGKRISLLARITDNSWRYWNKFISNKEMQSYYGRGQIFAVTFLKDGIINLR